MADAADYKKKRTFRKFTFRGVELEALLAMPTDKFVTEMLTSRARRRFERGLGRRPLSLLAKLRKSKEAAQETGEKPEVVKTHLRDMIILPEMVGCVIGIHNGKVFNAVEIKPEMIGYYLGEFSLTYKPVKHGNPGIGATHSSKFVPLK